MTKSAIDMGRVTTAMQQAELHGVALEKGWTDTWSASRLARAWWTREYKTIPWRSVGLAVFSVLYLLNPLDLIPDPIPILGVLDDATLLGFLFASVRADVKLFERWEVARGLLPGGDSVDPVDAVDVVDVEPA
jgi:uncharacterized membrane protein YkvA (DUF1232 family)